MRRSLDLNFHCEVFLFGMNETCGVPDGEQGNPDVSKHGFPHRGEPEETEQEEERLHTERERDVLPNNPPCPLT